MQKPKLNQAADITHTTLLHTLKAKNEQSLTFIHSSSLSSSVDVRSFFFKLN